MTEGEMVMLGDALKVVRDAAGIVKHREQLLAESRREARRPRRARRRAARLHRVPPWGDKLSINEFYRLAARLTRMTGIPHEVDHILPLLGELVSGLHVENNLRVVTKAVNRAKSNRYVVGDAGVEPATFRV